MENKIKEYLPPEINEKLLALIDNKLITNVHFDEESECAYWFETKDQIYSGKVSIVVKDDKINCKWVIDNEETPYIKVIEDPELTKKEALQTIAEWLRSGIKED